MLLIFESVNILKEKLKFNSDIYRKIDNVKVMGNTIRVITLILHERKMTVDWTVPENEWV